MEMGLKYNRINYKKWEIVPGQIMGTSMRKAKFKSISL